MKKLFLLLSLISLPMLASAQFGIKAGVNAGVADVKDPNVNWEDDGVSAGVHAGAFGRLSLLGFYLQPEVYYTFSRAQLRKTDMEVEKLNVDFHRLDIPVLVGIKLGNNLRLNAGPFASVNMKTRASNTDKTWGEELDDYYNRAQWGWQAGAGIDFWRFTLDARYETTVGNLRDFDSKNTTWNSYLPDDQKQAQFVVSLGFMLSDK